MARKLTYDDMSPDTIIICPICKAKNAKADQYCQSCKEDLTSAKLDILSRLAKKPHDERQKVIVCSFCGANNPKGAISCYNCADSFKKSMWSYKRTTEDLRERYLDLVIVSLVLSGVSFALGIWQNNYMEMTLGLGFIGLAVVFSLHRRWFYAPSGKDNSGAPRVTAEATSQSQPQSSMIERPAVHIRRRSMIVTRVGIALIGFGLVTLVGAFPFDNSTHNTTADIPAGQYVYFQLINQVVLGHLTGSFSASPGFVTFYIFTSDQFRSYSTTGFADHIYESDGSSGSFSVDLPGAGNYYMVADHSRALSLQSTSQHLSLTYLFSGIAFAYLIFGIAVLVLGVALVVTGRRIRNKVRRTVSATTNESASGLR